MGRPVSVLELTAEEAAELNRRIRGGTTSTRDCLRARIVLLRSRGMKQADVAREVGTSTASVNKWSQRFERQGFDGLVDRSGRGRKAAIAPEVVERVIGKAGSRAPGTRRRSTRTTAAEVGISASSVSRIWRGHRLKPHLRRTFKLSNDPQFEAKFWDVVGLYLDPPEKSIVLCCDEKTQIQALQRTQPGLPLGSGHIRTETHDYHRHGTITLFAAMNYLDGKLIDRLEAKHTHVEWLRFLKQIDKQTPAGVTLHVIADNYATHKHAKVKAWPRQASEVRDALHPDIEFLAQPRRTVLRRAHRGHPRGQLRQRRPTAARDRAPSGRTQRQPAPLQVGRQGRGHPRQDQPCASPTGADRDRTDKLKLFVTQNTRDPALAPTCRSRLA